MKRITYIRHAKSSWSDYNSKDIDRPLNKRGKRDAPIMVRKFDSCNNTPQAIITSPAIRAHQTADVFYKYYEKQIKIIVMERLYHGSEDDLESVIFEIHNELKEVLVFAHNPGLTYLLNKYSKSSIDNVPTCGLFTLESKSKEWDSFFDKVKVTQFLYPKMYL